MKLATSGSILVDSPITTKAFTNVRVQLVLLAPVLVGTKTDRAQMAFCVWEHEFTGTSRKVTTHSSQRFRVAGRLQQNKPHANRRPVRTQVATKVAIVAHKLRVLKECIKHKFPFGFVSSSVQITENSLAIELCERTELDHVKFGLGDVLRIKMNEANEAGNIGVNSC